MIQKAVKRSPQSPDFEGLDSYISHAYDQSGGIITLEFDKHIAEIQRNDAFVLKQGRLLREEEHAEKGRKNQPPAGGGGKK